MPKTTTKTKTISNTPYPVVRIEKLSTATMDLETNKITEQTNDNRSDANRADTEILSLLKSMKEEQLTKSDLHTINQMVDGKLESVHSELQLQNSKLTELEERLAKLESTEPKNFLNELNKQKLLRNNIAIMGIPPTPNEDLTSLVSNTFKLLVPHKLYKADSIYRTAPNSKQTLVIVKLNDYDAKIDVLNARSKKTIKLEQIGFKCSSNGSGTIFINNHVTPYFGTLLYHGRQAIKKKQIHSCWIASNGCQLRLVDKGEPIGFKTVEEFEKIIGTKSSNSTSKRIQPDDSSPEQNDQNTKRRATHNKD